MPYQRWFGSFPTNTDGWHLNERPLDCAELILTCTDGSKNGHSWNRSSQLINAICTLLISFFSEWGLKGHLGNWLQAKFNKFPELMLQRFVENAWIRNVKTLRDILSDVSTRSHLLSRLRRTCETVTNRNEIYNLGRCLLVHRFRNSFHTTFTF